MKIKNSNEVSFKILEIVKEPSELIYYIDRFCMVLKDYSWTDNVMTFKLRPKEKNEASNHKRKNTY